MNSFGQNCPPFFLPDMAGMENLDVNELTEDNSKEDTEDSDSAAEDDQDVADGSGGLVRSGLERIRRKAKAKCDSSSSTGQRGDHYVFFFWFGGILGSASRVEFTVSLSNHVGFTPRLLYSSTHHSSESFTHLKTG